MFIYFQSLQMIRFFFFWLWLPIYVILVLTPVCDCINHWNVASYIYACMCKCTEFWINLLLFIVIESISSLYLILLWTNFNVLTYSVPFCPTFFPHKIKYLDEMYSHVLFLILFKKYLSRWGRDKYFSSLGT